MMEEHSNCNCSGHDHGHGVPKQRLIYILLAVFLGWIGIHNFYAGYTGKAIIQLILGLTGFLSIVSWIWAIIDIITVTRDAQGNLLV